MKRPWLVLLTLLALLVAGFFFVAVGGEILGRFAPERVTFAYIARLNASPEEMWTRLGHPTRRTEIREWADGTRHEAFPGDTSGSLVLLYEPYTRVVAHFRHPNAETWRIETLTPEGGGAIARIEESAILRTSWHRLLFPPRMKAWAIERLREYGRAAGQPKPVIIRDTSSALAFTLITEAKVPDEVSLSRPPEAAARRETIDPYSRDLPKLGEYVFVEELPVPIVKTPPIYPELARESRVQGTVVVQALVGKDGRVKDTRVAESVSLLDDAALDCVKQWVFKPALARGAPVAVWVAIPVRFKLRSW
jgi:TonB family protein